MADQELAPQQLDPDHDHDHPRGGRWARWVAISVALILAVAIAPQSWKLPLGALSILALLVGIWMLMMDTTGSGL